LGDGSTTVRIQRGCRFRPYILFIRTTSRLELDTSLTAAGVGGGSQGSLWILWRCIVDISPQVLELADPERDSLLCNLVAAPGSVRLRVGVSTWRQDLLCDPNLHCP